MANLAAYIDGGSLGNPGSSGIGVVIAGPADCTIRIARWIGHQDNNVAEYIALLEALQCALGLKAISANLKEEVTRTHRMFVVAVVGMMTPGYSPRRRKHSV